MERASIFSPEQQLADLGKLRAKLMVVVVPDHLHEPVHTLVQAIGEFKLIICNTANYSLLGNLILNQVYFILNFCKDLS